LPWLKLKLGADRLMTAGAVGTAAALVLYAVARDVATGLTASLFAGMSWIAVLSSLNVSAQVALPDWVRGRGLAIFATAFFGAMTIGSVVWGHLAGMVGLPAAHAISAVGMLAAILLTRRWKLQTAEGTDLTPSMHWPAPVIPRQIDADRGPVLVTVEYRVRPEDRDAFLDALTLVATERRRDGAYDWGIFENAEDPELHVETFYVDSWVEHLRQHERVTHADRLVE